MKQIKTGFFTMDTVHAVLAMNDLEEAKNLVLGIVKESTNAKAESVIKAQTMVARSNSIKNLALGVSNFMLAHPSENLKTL